MPNALKNFIDVLKSKRHLNAIISILIIFAGVDLLVVGQKELWVHYLGLLLIFLGVAYLLFAFLPYLKKEYRVKKKSLASRFLSFISLKGRLQPFFLIFGIVIISLDLVYNLVVSPTPQLLTFDSIVLLFGGWLIFHNFVPKKFERERDFVFMFLFFLILILVIPLLILRLTMGNFEESVNVYSANLLVPPLSGLLGIFGVPITNVNGIWITMTLKGGTDAVIGITTECSGIFSFAIFASAFMAFILIEFERITKRVVALLALGMFTAYLANVLRMTVIMLVGYHYDSSNLQAMLFAHANVGWIIFLLWISLFWVLMYKFLMKEKKPVIKKPEPKGVACSVCSEILTPSVPGYRCKCGKFYHLECIESLKKCPSCNKKLERDEEAIPKPRGS
ncbi:MAG: archaeosortase/exosortase family protein [Thermoplasmata archaeon]|nr:archaeosortase/exosortase family protein [Thermoplasmata archaeon]